MMSQDKFIRYHKIYNISVTSYKMYGGLYLPTYLHAHKVQIKFIMQIKLIVHDTFRAN